MILFNILDGGKLMTEKPTAAFVLSLIAGILILIGGLGAAIIGAICGAMMGALEPYVPGAGFVGGLVVLSASLGLISGILVIIGAIMINKAEPSSVRNGSIIVLIFSILSLIFSNGGFYIGFILGLIGGILGLVWKPSPPTPPAPGLPAARICPNCGAQIDPSFNVCPYCGKVIPRA